MKRFFTLLLAMTLLLCGCGSDNETVSTPESVSEEGSKIIEESADNISEETTEESQEVSTEESKEVSEESQEEIVIPLENQNLLTGIYSLTDEAIGKRPVAVMVNNIEASLPQYGIAQADIIFEMPVEGGQTRLMAMYGDYTQVPRICSVRSCRGYFPAVSEGFDAIYVNWGMNEVIRDYINSLNLTQYDAKDDYRMFDRDTDRKNAGYSLEHTGYFEGSMLPEILESDKKRTDIESDKTKTAFNFYKMDEFVVPDGEACLELTVNFSGIVSGFSYDSTTKTYKKTYNGNPHMDVGTNTQLAFTNLIILETSIGNDPNGLHKTVNWYGGDSSVAYYISQGAVQKIHWKKANEQSKIQLFDENGNELFINCGKSYIAFNSVGATTFQ